MSTKPNNNVHIVGKQKEKNTVGPTGLVSSLDQLVQQYAIMTEDQEATKITTDPAHSLPPNPRTPRPLTRPDSTNPIVTTPGF